MRRSQHHSACGPSPRSARVRGRHVPVLVLVVAVIASAACAAAPSDSGGGPTSARPPRSAAAPCPVSPVKIVVTVNQWADIVEQLAGACGAVTTIIGGATGDPHDYEPTAADNATFGSAQLVVRNGLDYDPWADKAIATLSIRPPVIDGGAVSGRPAGENPHLWYSPADVERMATAITTRLRSLAPGASGYFDQQAATFRASLQPYLDAIAGLKASFAGRTYGATESVFDDLAAAVGLRDVTPSGYRASAANESDPAPGDVFEFQQALSGGQVAVLIYNSQSEGSVPEQLRNSAVDAGVPVVRVTETIPPDAGSFVDWQLSQLRSLEQALAANR